MALVSLATRTPPPDTTIPVRQIQHSNAVIDHHGPAGFSASSDELVRRRLNTTAGMLPLCSLTFNCRYIWFSDIFMPGLIALPHTPFLPLMALQCSIATA